MVTYVAWQDLVVGVLNALKWPLSVALGGYFLKDVLHGLAERLRDPDTDVHARAAGAELHVSQRVKFEDTAPPSPVPLDAADAHGVWVGEVKAVEVDESPAD
jgi:hypothetical protein